MGTTNRKIRHPISESHLHRHGGCLLSAMFANAFPCRAVNQSAWMNRAEVSVSSGPANDDKGSKNNTSHEKLPNSGQKNLPGIYMRVAANMMTPEGQLALAKINSELEEILKKSPYVQGLDANTDLPKLRAVLLARKRELTAANETAGEASYVEEDRQIPVRDGSTIAVSIHKPKSPPKDGCPIFVVYHGGGFVLGNLENETLLCRKFTELGGIAVNVDYRLAPENPFPTPCHDAYDAL